jgi:hypothetical protein
VGSCAVHDVESVLAVFAFCLVNFLCRDNILYESTVAETGVDGLVHRDEWLFMHADETRCRRNDSAIEAVDHGKERKP